MAKKSEELIEKPVASKKRGRPSLKDSKKKTTTKRKKTTKAKSTKKTTTKKSTPKIVNEVVNEQEVTTTEVFVPENITTIETLIEPVVEALSVAEELSVESVENATPEIAQEAIVEVTPEVPEVKNEVPPVKKKRTIKNISVKKSNSNVVDSKIEIDEVKPRRTLPSSKRGVIISPVFENAPEIILAPKNNKRTLKLNLESSKKLCQTTETKVVEKEAINQNSAFFNTPSIFDKFNINITVTDLDETTDDQKVNEENIVSSDSSVELNETAVISENQVSETDTVVENPISETEEALETIIDESTETLDEVTEIENIETENNSVIDEIDESNEDTLTEETLLDASVEDLLLEDCIDELLEDEVNSEDSLLNLENQPEAEENVLKEVATPLQPVIPETTSPDNPVGKFFDSSIPSMASTVNNTFSKIKKSIVNNVSPIFKKFTFEEASLANNPEFQKQEEFVKPENTLTDIQKALENFSTTADTIPNNLEVSADPVATITNTVQQDVLPTQLVDESTNYDSQNIDYSNVITPLSDSSRISEDDDIETDEEYKFSNKLIDKLISEAEEFDKNSPKEEVDFDNISSEDLEKLEKENEYNDETFSIEAYFGIDSEQEELDNDENNKTTTPVIEEPVEEDLVEELSDEDILDEIQIEDLENSQVVENLLTEAFSTKDLDGDLKEELLSELLSSEETQDNLDIDLEESLLEEALLDSLSEEDLKPQDTKTEELPVSENSSDFLKIIDSLTKAISELETLPEVQTPSTDPYLVDELPNELISDEITEEKAINILINKDDIFSISILNESYEIVSDFDGISVLSENIHISTPKHNFFVKVGNKYIEIHNKKDYFVLNTNFEDIEFANAINNITFAKKNNKIELIVKEAFKLSSVNNKIELSMLNKVIADLSSQTQPQAQDEFSICDNKTLLISEETQKVYLPYTIEDVMKKLRTSDEYQTVQEVIDNEYTLPLSTFKMPIISRFKEAYRFMRIKEKSSVYAAVDLAVELMFNSNLNPAVIRAAKDLKELNIYLDCLYENEVEKFDCFKIIYKVLPKIK